MKPTPPPPTYIMRGLYLPFVFGPAWLWENHYRTASGVALSGDGSKTYPARLTAIQQVEVNSLRALVKQYAHV